MNIIKRSFLTGLVLWVSLGDCFSQAPDFAWARSAGGIYANVAHDIAVDGSGNSYITGYFRGSITFGSTTLSTGGGADVFIAKYDVAGNLAWAKKTGGGDNDMGFSIAVDANGNSYVTGYFSGSATFGSTTLTSNGLTDVFIAKHDPTGNVLWARSAGGIYNDEGTSISVDANGNAYITGDFEDTISFGNITLSSTGAYDIFIAKYDATGNVQWAKGAGGISEDHGVSIAGDGSSNSYITGRFYGSATFGNTTLSGIGIYDIFVAKYDATGNMLWARSAGGASHVTTYGIAVDGNGNSFITGEFIDTLTIGNIELTSIGHDIYIAKYDAAGNVLWAKSAGGTANGYSFNIAADDSGNSYITGAFSGDCTFGTTTLSSNGNYDVFVVKSDAAGNVLWAKSAGGADQELSYGIAIDASGNSYITGYFTGFPAFGSTTLSYIGQEDVFIAKLGNDPLSLSESSTSTVSTSPNPFTVSFQISLPTTESATAILTDLLGREVHRQNLTPETQKSEITISPSQNLPSGLYILQIHQGKEIRQARVVKQ